MVIHAVLPPPALRVIRTALVGSTFALMPVVSVPRLRDPHACVVDAALTRSEPERSEAREYAVSHPHVGFVLAGELTRDAAVHVTVSAAEGASSAVILPRFDTAPQITAAIYDATCAALPHRVLWALRDHTERLPARTFGALRSSLVGPLAADDVASLAAAANVSTRTLYRHLQDAGFDEPKRVHRAARFIRCVRPIYMRGVRLEEIARRAGYFAYGQFQAHVRELTGFSPREIRFARSPATLTPMIARALVPSYVAERETAAPSIEAAAMLSSGTDG